MPMAPAQRHARKYHGPRPVSIDRVMRAAAAGRQACVFERSPGTREPGENKGAACATGGAKMAEVDGDKLNALIGKMLGDLGGAFSVPTVRIGLRLGLFDALAGGGPQTASALSSKLGLSERYVREWALAQAANGYVDYL